MVATVLQRLIRLPGDKLKALVHARYPAEPVALFRFFGAVFVLADVLATWDMAELFWGTGRELAIIDAAYGAWATVLICLALGYRTTFMAVANYALTFPLLLDLDPTFEYHFDYYARTWAFYLMFLQSWRAYSIDSLMARRRAESAGAPPPTRTVPLWIVCVFVFQFSLDYFDAGYRKLNDPTMWGEGFGLYWPMIVRWSSTEHGLFLLDWEWPMLALSHFTLWLELLFPVLILARPTRYVAILGGVALHVGIIYTLPINYFGELMLGLYALFIPISVIRKVEGWSRRATAPLLARVRELGWPPPVDSEPPPPPRSRFARWRPYLFGACVALLITVKLGHINKLPRSIAKPLAEKAYKVNSFVRHFVFMSFHFKKSAIMEVELEYRDGTREHFPWMTGDGYPDELTRASTRAWIFMLRVSKKRKPNWLLRSKMMPWIQAQYPRVCAVHVWRRWVIPPKEFSGSIDLWSHAKREYVGRFKLDRKRGKCPLNEQSGERRGE